MMFVIAGILLRSDHRSLMLLGIIVLGLAMAHGVELQHQALHATGFRSRIANELWGIVLGLPMLVSYYEYRINHLKHHSLLGTPENKEHFDYGSGCDLIDLLRRYLLVEHYRNFVVNLARVCTRRDVTGFTLKQQPKVRRFYLIALVFISTLLACSITDYSATPALDWVAALLLVASPVHALIELPEHYACDQSSTDPFRNTRTVTSNAFMTWFTNSNNLHVEHHLRPELPLQELPNLHREICDRIQFKNKGYADFVCEAYLAQSARYD